MTIYAVNGKEPIVAWIPSLDTAGNGTTTLTDLSGNGRNGTLANFALTGSTSNWVADTGAGGVRALDFDGTNDRVSVGSATWLNGAAAATLSFWGKKVDAGNLYLSLEGTNYFSFLWGSNEIIYVYCTRTNFAFPFASYTSSLSQWIHAVVVFDGSQATNINRTKLYINNSAVTLTANGGNIDSVLGTLGTFYLGYVGGSYGAARIDDVRLFNQVLDTSDIAYLYNSGSGRGRVTPAGSRLIGKSSLVGGSALVGPSALVSA